MTITVVNNLPATDTYTNLEPITPGASPFVWQNTNSFGVKLFISGGLVTLVEFKSWQWQQFPTQVQWKSVGVPYFIDLNTQDSVRITYSLGLGLVAPTLEYTGF